MREEIAAKKRKEKKVAVSKATKKEMLHYMKLVREIEDRLEQKLYRQGKIVGGVYVGRGQEAISVGTAIHIQEEDMVAPSHRDMGVFLMQGVTPRRIAFRPVARWRPTTSTRGSGAKPATVPVATIRQKQS